MVLRNFLLLPSLPPSLSVIRHQTAGSGNGPFDTTDMFRVDIYYDKRLIGQKLVPSTLTKET